MDVWSLPTFNRFPLLQCSNIIFNTIINNLFCRLRLYNYVYMQKALTSISRSSLKRNKKVAIDHLKFIFSNILYCKFKIPFTFSIGSPEAF